MHFRSDEKFLELTKILEINNKGNYRGSVPIFSRPKWNFPKIFMVSVFWNTLVQVVVKTKFWKRALDFCWYCFSGTGLKKNDMWLLKYYLKSWEVLKKCKFWSKKRFFVITSNLHTNFGISDHTASDVIIAVKFETKLTWYLKLREEIDF